MVSSSVKVKVVVPGWPSQSGSEMVKAWVPRA
jgi:hypothetical protein